MFLLLTRCCSLLQTQRVNGEWKEEENECEEAINQSFQYTTYILRELEPDSTYRVELRAHNAIGYSLSSEIKVKTARGEPLHYYSYNGVRRLYVSAPLSVACICCLLRNAYT